MRKYYAAICAGSLWGIFQAFTIYPKQGGYLSSIIQRIAMYRTYFIPIEMLGTLLDLLPFIIFQIVYGTLLYQRFCTISVFYFSRCTKRGEWFVKEVLQLYLASLLYFVSILFVTIGVLEIFYSVYVDIAGLWIGFYYILINSLWAFATALIVNLVAIKKGSVIGFVVIMLMEVASLLILPLWDENGIFSLMDVANLDRNVFLLKCNPISHIVLKWHTSTNRFVESVIINELRLDCFDLNESVIILFFVSEIIVAIGAIIVKRHELISNNIETNGV